MLILKRITIVLLIITLFASIGCSRSNNVKNPGQELSVLVFVTGVITGSPTYELMVEGALSFAKENPQVSVKIYEAQMNQALWEQQLAEMVSGGQYDIVIGSNPSLPEICENVSKMFPNQKYIILDANHTGNPNIKSYFYNQYEQSLFLGYLAGNVTTSKKIGFIAAQEYPLLINDMVPGFIKGARLVDPGIELDFRVIGSWADAGKAAELTSAMIDSGVDVFTSIAGGASQGLIRTAVDRGAYMVWYNTEAYNLAPGFIVGCGIMRIKEITENILKDALNNNIRYGETTILGIKDGSLVFSTIFDRNIIDNFLEIYNDLD